MEPHLIRRGLPRCSATPPQADGRPDFLSHVPFDTNAPLINETSATPGASRVTGGLGSGW